MNILQNIYTYGDISLQFIHSKRSSEAVDEINTFPRYGGTIVHDCWAMIMKDLLKGAAAIVSLYLQNTNQEKNIFPLKPCKKYMPFLPSKK
ncbi:MAG: hypothetical protein A2577_18290 [Bdellovibrionales bacterium RIFOXYD1_FULL_36_51]|nr:MAG: hypothetical protein A2577_18290 [Bdellovibrionales bacterium RIFOXYD1_FULL_36_51]